MTYQKEDGKWYFTLPKVDETWPAQEFGPYDDKDRADYDEAGAEAMWG